MNVRIFSRQVEEAIGYELVFLKGSNDGKSLFANTAVISFYDPPDRRGLLENYKPVDYSAVTKRLFQIALHDIDIAVLKEFNLDFKSYFTEADELAEFIYDVKQDGLDIICQCECGQSRSAGCAAAIREHFYGDGIKIFTDYRYYPNQLVYNKVYDALEMYKKKSTSNPFYYHVSKKFLFSQFDKNNGGGMFPMPLRWCTSPALRI